LFTPSLPSFLHRSSSTLSLQASKKLAERHDEEKPQ
jgi:hypothetical protein